MTRRLFPAALRSGAMFYLALAATLLVFGVFFDRMSARAGTAQEGAAAMHAQLERDRASPDVLQVAKWAVETRDHAGLPFFVVDKARARLFAFDGSGNLQGSAPVLLGARRGDGPGVPTTPAGRFVADTWRSALGDGIVWVNGEAALTLHRVSSAAAPGRAVQRLESDETEDRRISDGSLHVGDEFYSEWLGPLRGQASVAYVLPEQRPARELFAQRMVNSRRPS